MYEKVCCTYNVTVSKTPPKFFGPQMKSPITVRDLIHATLLADVQKVPNFDRSIVLWYHASAPQRLGFG
jgi:hypothetical protein